MIMLIMKNPKKDNRFLALVMLVPQKQVLWLVYKEFSKSLFTKLFMHGRWQIKHGNACFMTHNLSLEQFYQNTWCLSPVLIFLTVKGNLKSSIRLWVTEQRRLEGVWVGDYGQRLNITWRLFGQCMKQQSGSNLDAK